MSDNVQRPTPNGHVACRECGNTLKPDEAFAGACVRHMTGDETEIWLASGAIGGTP
jgi:hypothetical protein